MSGRLPERNVRSGWRDDVLSRYACDYKLIAHCRRPGCHHERELHIALLLRLFAPQTPLGRMAARFRCHRCGMRGARVEARYIGPTGDGG
ncbi:MAG TPA: hypothetical protein VHB68_06040 [Steroidobacteraceae bacterium]|nr:hypothetical protein [Steroidobacteraceae bacterium]